jgi:hypothetical protein
MYTSTVGVERREKREIEREHTEVMAREKSVQE